jgi:hypothetical protein
MIYKCMLVAALLLAGCNDGIVDSISGQRAEPCEIEQFLNVASGFRYTRPETTHCFYCKLDAGRMSDSALRVCGRTRPKDQPYKGRVSIGKAEYPKCKKCPSQSDFSPKCKARIKEVIAEREKREEKLHSCQQGYAHGSFWFEHDLKKYGKPYYEMTEQEMKNHDLHLADLESARQRIDEMLLGEE